MIVFGDSIFGIGSHSLCWTKKKKTFAKQLFFVEFFNLVIIIFLVGRRGFRPCECEPRSHVCVWWGVCVNAIISFFIVRTNIFATGAAIADCARACVWVCLSVLPFYLLFNLPVTTTTRRPKQMCFEQKQRRHHKKALRARDAKGNSRKEKIHTNAMKRQFVFGVNFIYSRFNNNTTAIRATVYCGAARCSLWAFSGTHFSSEISNGVPSVCTQRARRLSAFKKKHTK